MAEESAKTVDSAQGSGTAGSPPEIKQAQGSFSKISRDLCDDDFKNPAIGRILLSQIDRAEQQISTLDRYKQDFYESDKKVGILEERLKGMSEVTTVKGEATTVKDILLTFMGVGLGFLPSLWSKQNYFWVGLIFTLILFLLALFWPILHNLFKREQK